MKPCSCISRMPSSLVAPHTPAWVVTGTPSSRATSNAGPLREGRVAGDVEGQLEAEHVVAGDVAVGEVAELRGRRSTPPGPAGCCRRPARTGPEPLAARRRPPRHARRSAGRATSRRWWSRPRRWPRLRRAGCRRRRPAGGTPCPIPGSTRRNTGSASSRRRSRASRSATCADACRSCPASRCRRWRRSRSSPSGTCRAGPTAAILSSITSTSLPVSTCRALSMVSTVPPRNTTGRPEPKWFGSLIVLAPLRGPSRTRWPSARPATVEVRPLFEGWGRV